MLRRLAFSALFGLAAVSALADDITPTKLYDLCRSEKGSPGDMSCSAFIAGVGVGFDAGQFGLEHGFRYCPPKEMTVGQTRLIIEKAMRDHPELLDAPIGDFVGGALVAAFPCKRSN